MSQPSRPNFLFLFPDQLRWDWVGCHGTVPVRTPNVDALAARGMKFDQVRCNSPLCAPSRAALATGMRYHRCGVPSNGVNLDPQQLTFFQVLRNAGYSVGACGKTDLQKHGAWKGLDGRTPEIEQLGFTHPINQAGKWDAVNSGWPKPQDPYMNYLHQQGLAQVHVEDFARRNRMRQGDSPKLATWPTPLAREHYTDDFCGRMGERLLGEFPADRPWLLWINFPSPHEPFDAPSELLDRWRDVEFPLPQPWSENVAEEDHQAIRRHYAAMIEGIDQWTGRLLAAVAARGELENTVVIFTSDHGEMLGDHGLWAKSHPHEGSVHVPLVMAGPTIGAGQRSDALVELIDLGPTVLELAGLDIPDDWDARSLGPVLRGTASDHRPYQVSALGDWRMIFDGRWKLVERRGEPGQLFDLATDPHEETNRAGEPDSACQK